MSTHDTTHVPLNQKTVLAYLENKRGAGPITATDIGFSIDCQCGCVYSSTHVVRVLRGLQKKNKVRYTEHETWNGWEIL